MKKGLSFYMQADLAGKRADLPQNIPEDIRGHKHGFPACRRAEAAGQIADAGNLDVDFLKRVHCALLSAGLSFIITAGSR
ncbi:hypothetical protein D3C76_1725870 [compost metagenome]